MTITNLENFCKKINYKFNNIELLTEALTHPSFSKNSKNKTNYQRLEFLGDKVLGLIIGEFLITKYKLEREGLLSKRQAHLVSGKMLAEIALEIGVDEVLVVSKGEENLGGKLNKNNLENAMEATIGAIYLDSNFEEVKKIVLKLWHNHLEQNLEAPQDPVSKLQELTQLKCKKIPKYEITKVGGSDHDPIFLAKVLIPDSNLEFEEKGKSKKEAQKNVAIKALNKINTKNNA